MDGKEKLPLPNNLPSRRDFLRMTGEAAGVAAGVMMFGPAFAQENPDELPAELRPVPRWRPGDPPFGPFDEAVDDAQERMQIARMNYDSAVYNKTGQPALGKLVENLTRFSREYGMALRAYEANGTRSYPGLLIAEGLGAIERRLRSGSIDEQEAWRQFNEFTERQTEANRIQLRGFMCGYYPSYCLVQ
ncbi:MAG: hypothetical protein G01um10148_1005 [Parcubacteria group bacterium Gr01-1014_8]|nr:MAG: hypothetical protein G01um10148_1005 [Parcubacteria group bacterium Gr01-1014_8]